MAGVRIAAQFTGEDRAMNGLNNIVDDLLEEDPRAKRYLIAEYHVSRKTEEVDDGSILTPTVKLDHIEPVAAKDVKTVMRLLANAYTARQSNDAQTNGQADLFSHADEEADADTADAAE